MTADTTQADKPDGEAVSDIDRAHASKNRICSRCGALLKSLGSAANHCRDVHGKNVTAQDVTVPDLPVYRDEYAAEIESWLNGGDDGE